MELHATGFVFYNKSLPCSVILPGCFPGRSCFGNLLGPSVELINNALGILVLPRLALLISVDHPHVWGKEPSEHRGAPVHSRTGDLVGPQEPLHRLTGDVCWVGGREDPHLYLPSLSKLEQCPLCVGQRLIYP